MTISSQLPNNLIIPQVILYIAVFWVICCWLSARISGWYKLAKRYQATEPPKGKKLSIYSCKIGPLYYNNCLTLHACPEGFYISLWTIIRVGHPTLFLPWTELNNPQFKRVLFAKSVELEVGSPAINHIVLSQKDFDELQQPAKDLIGKTS